MVVSRLFRDDREGFGRETVGFSALLVLFFLEDQA